MVNTSIEISKLVATGRVQAPICLARNRSTRSVSTAAAEWLPGKRHGHRGRARGRARVSAAGSIVSRFVRKHHPRKHVIETSRDLLGARMADAPWRATVPETFRFGGDRLARLSYDLHNLWLRAICTGQDNCLIDIAMLFIFMISTGFARAAARWYAVSRRSCRADITRAITANVEHSEVPRPHAHITRRLPRGKR